MAKEGAEEVIEVNMEDMALQPGYTVNLEELFGTQNSYCATTGFFDDTEIPIMFN
jgi:hypothetical protein